MHWSDINFAPSTKTLRQFALLWLVFFLGFACWQAFVQENWWLAGALGAAALAIGPLGLIRPQAIRLIFVGWMVLAFPLGWVVSRVLLAVLYYGLFTPVATLFRLIGRDALVRRKPAHATSYWVAKPQTN